MASIWQKVGQFLTGVSTGTSATTPTNTTASGTLSDNPNHYGNNTYRDLTVRHALRAVIRDIKTMDTEDGRVKRIHNRIKRDAVKGGLQLRFESTEAKKISLAFQQFKKRLNLQSRELLENRARLFARDGNLPLQWIIGDTANGPRVVDAKAMPITTLQANTDDLGRFIDRQNAWQQVDAAGNVLASFNDLQLTNARLDPENYDNPASFGRPFLDAARKAYKRLTMTEDDAVVRRRSRAASRNLHVLEGASQDDIDAYERDVNIRRRSPDQDFYSNKKAAISNISGDANFDQVADINMLLDAFFAVAGPKGLFGYTEGLSRDILEDLKRDYYEDVDSLQDSLAGLFLAGFKLDLLLQGIDPDSYEFDVVFAERMTENAVQRTDRALKQQAIGASLQTVLETAGLNPEREAARIAAERKDPSKYGHDDHDEDLDNPKQPRVSVTPSNARKGDSATAISH